MLIGWSGERVLLEKAFKTGLVKWGTNYWAGGGCGLMNRNFAGKEGTTRAVFRGVGWQGGGRFGVVMGNALKRSELWRIHRFERARWGVVAWERSSVSKEMLRYEKEKKAAGITHDHFALEVLGEGKRVFFGLG